MYNNSELSWYFWLIRQNKTQHKYNDRIKCLWNRIIFLDPFDKYLSKSVNLRYLRSALWVCIVFQRPGLKLSWFSSWVKCRFFPSYFQAFCQNLESSNDWYPLKTVLSFLSFLIFSSVLETQTCIHVRAHCVHASLWLETYCICELLFPHKL